MTVGTYSPLTTFADTVRILFTLRAITSGRAPASDTGARALDASHVAATAGTLLKAALLAIAEVCYKI